MNFYKNEIDFEDDIETCDGYANDRRDLAGHYLNLFLSFKKVDLRGVDFSEDISTVLRYAGPTEGISEGLDAVYAIMARNKDKLKFEKSYSDIKYVLSLLDECAKLGVPKCYAGGVIIVFLKLCEGCV